MIGNQSKVEVRVNEKAGGAQYKDFDLPLIVGFGASVGAELDSGRSVVETVPAVVSLASRSAFSRLTNRAASRAQC